MERKDKFQNEVAEYEGKETSTNVNPYEPLQEQEAKELEGKVQRNIDDLRSQQKKQQHSGEEKTSEAPEGEQHKEGLFNKLKEKAGEAFSNVKEKVVHGTESVLEAVGLKEESHPSEKSLDEQESKQRLSFSRKEEFSKHKEPKGEFEQITEKHVVEEKKLLPEGELAKDAEWKKIDEKQEFVPIDPKGTSIDEQVRKIQLEGHAKESKLQ